jgi:hypothetical protein
MTLPRRVVRLLDPPELTPRQLAQRRYQKSLKGKAAARRHQRKRRQDAAFRAAEVLRVRAWEAANPVQRRVYKRTWDRMRKLRLEQPHRQGGVITSKSED